MIGALAAFIVAASLLTITPGLDTALVLRTRLLESARAASWAAAGIILGVLLWGVLAGVGLAALIKATPIAFRVLKIAGALYLAWLGAVLILHPRRSFDPHLNSADQTQHAKTAQTIWFKRGLLTNALNPKVGIFYLSFLPQFIPPNVAAGPFMVLLAAIHAVLGGIWFTALIAATGPLQRLLSSPASLSGLDRSLGVVFLLVALGLGYEGVT